MHAAVSQRTKIFLLWWNRQGPGWGEREKEKKRRDNQLRIDDWAGSYMFSLLECGDRWRALNGHCTWSTGIMSRVTLRRHLVGNTTVPHVSVQHHDSTSMCLRLFEISGYIRIPGVSLLTGLGYPSHGWWWWLTRFVSTDPPAPNWPSHKIGQCPARSSMFTVKPRSTKVIPAGELRVWGSWALTVDDDGRDFVGLNFRNWFLGFWTNLLAFPVGDRSPIICG